MTLDLLPHRFTLKIFCDGGRRELAPFVPVFHRWIQQRRLGRQLIDVADYSHVPNGPGVMLVAHEAHYRMDEGAGRLGLLYARRRCLEGDLAARLARLFVSTLEACAELEREPELGALRFRSDELELGIDDRLLAPNTEQTSSWLRPALEPLLARLYDGASVSALRHGSPKSCFGVRITAQSTADVRTLLARLGSLPREGR